MTAVLHLRGPVLVGPEEVVGEAWVVGGRITYERPAGDVTAVDGWVVPGLVDAHCHVGLDAHGAVDETTSQAQALADRDAGALLLRDAGSPADTRWVDDRDDLPRLVRAGRHIARPKRYIREFADEVEPEDLVETVRRQAARGDGWVKLVGDWIDRATGDLAPCWPLEALRPAIAAAHEAGARVTAHCFSEDSLADLVEAGIDCIEHATGPGRADAAAARRARRRRRADADQHRHVPRHRRAGAGPVPGVRRPHARPARAPARHRARRPTTPGCRSTPGRTRAARSPTAGSSTRSSSWPGRACRPSTRWGRPAGRPGPGCGRDGLSEGASADLLVLDGDPRQDLRVLQAPAAVVLRGARWS